MNHCLRNSMKKHLLLSFLVLFLPFFALISPYLTKGVPYTHDGENHLARFANYKVALREGQLPPRFAPNLNNHYGYPVFNYNYPLANILSVPFSVLGISYEFTFKILMISAFAIGGWGAYSWLKAMRLGNEKTRVLSVVSYLLAPFTVNLVYVRGNIGEAWALALFPWLLWLTHQFKNSKRVSYFSTSAIITGFLLSHNVSVLFGGLIWFIYTLIIFKKDWEEWRRLLWKGGLAFGMSLWFWLPAMIEKNQIILDDAGLSNQFGNHFVKFTQLITSPLQFGFSHAAPINTMSLSVGLSGFIFLVLGTLLAFKKQRKSLTKKYLWLSVIMGWMLFTLQTPLSSGFWYSLPLVRFIQFPWRLSLYFIVFTLPLMVILMKHHSFFKYLLIAIFGFQLLAVLRLQPADYFHKNTIDYDLFSQSTTTANENLPKTFTYGNISDWSPEPRIIEGNADFSVSHWDGTTRKYDLVVSEKALIVEPTMYFVGWKTVVNDKNIEYADMVETDGRIGYWLEPGGYEVRAGFTQETWSRIVGNTISIITGAIALWFVAHEVVNFKKK